MENHYRFGQDEDIGFNALSAGVSCQQQQNSAQGCEKKGWFLHSFEIQICCNWTVRKRLKYTEGRLLRGASNRTLSLVEPASGGGGGGGRSCSEHTHTKNYSSDDPTPKTFFKIFEL
jgi:hypothetical protein